MLDFAMGDQVRQILTPIKGKIIDAAIDKVTLQRQFQVAWSDEDGDHSRFFYENEIEADLTQD